MRKSLAAAAVVAFLAGCTPLSPGADPRPAPVTASPVASSTPSTAAPSPGLSPLPDAELPLAFPVPGRLIDDAPRVVSKLHEVAAGLPVLKVDLTATQATLTALLPDSSVASYRWSDGQITRVDSDIEHLEQATFDPASFPLESAARMFDIADLRGVRGDAILQIVEYREGQVLLSITSRPASTTVFFRPDGTAVTELGYTSVEDLTAGLAEVVGSDTQAYAVGFNPTRGYWADLPDEEPGVTLNRSRVAGLPVFETRRGETAALAPFDPQLIDPAVLATLISQAQTDPTSPCNVTIDRSTQRSAGVVRLDCSGTVTFADLRGRDMTHLIQR